LELEKNYLNQISDLIKQARTRAEVFVNSELVTLYWHVGKVIKTQILEGSKPEYGKRVISELSEELTKEYGRGYGKSNLFNMAKFYEAFPNEQIFHAVHGKLTWTHIKRLAYIEDPLRRQFYLDLAVNERWSSRTLNERIDGMLYERTLISNKPEETVKSDLALLSKQKIMSKDLVLRDPYVLDFLGLKDNFSENDLEQAIIHELERFLLEFGLDFAFIGRQVRITINDTDFYIDLLFYHRKMKRLVAIELKLGKFKPEYKGQVELYLNWLAKNDMNEGDNLPIGIILCAEKDEEVIELLNLGDSDIHVAQFLLKAFEDKLPKAISNAKALLQQRHESYERTKQP